MPNGPKTERKGFAQLFAEELLNEGQKAVFKNFMKFESYWPTVEKVCPACRKLYSLNENIEEHEGHNLRINYPENLRVARIYCYDCGKNVRDWGKCEDGTPLTSFSIGNNPRRSTLAYILLSLPDPWKKERYSTALVSKVTDISNVLRPLHYLNEELKLVSPPEMPEGKRFYAWRKTKKGKGAAEGFLKEIDDNWGFGQQLREFIEKRKEDALANDIILALDKTKRITIRLTKDEAEGKIEKEEFERVVMHAVSKKTVKG